MQTFLPATTYTESASILDNKRLGKQRVESLQILQIIGRKQGWLDNPNNLKGFWNHPAVKMWEENPYALKTYTIIICHEWRTRKFKDTVEEKIHNLSVPPSDDIYPSWFTPLSNHFLRIVLSHQSNLVRKDAAYYAPKFAPDLPNNLPYHWPI